MNKWEDLLNPAFIIGYTALLSIIGALFVFAKQESLVLAIVAVLTNILTGATTFYFTKTQINTKETTSELHKGQ